MSFVRTTFMTAYRARLYPNYWDILALLLVLAVIIMFALNAIQMTTPYQLGQVIPISLNPHMLPIYAGRTVIRMLIALVFSLLFTFTFATWAAKSRRAEKLIIPIIDVLQSVPILGFLSVTVTGFIALFPGSLLGPECAAIFAIFTSQAWNMALGFYQTVRSVPAEVNEAARMFHLSAWQRFWRIDVPFSMPGLLWNTMVSMSAGWFFVVAAEAITVANQQILLPGIGSYIAVAIKAANMRAICYAVLAMFIVILIYDQLLFRPLVAWSEKFKSEQIGTEKSAQSWVMNLFRRTQLLRYVGRKINHAYDAFVNIRIFLSSTKVPIVSRLRIHDERLFSFVWNGLFFIVGLMTLVFLGKYIFVNFSFGEIKHVLFLGLVTAFRVFILIILCSIFWVPVGVWIGLRPKVARVIQPIAQLLAAFPANLLYPFIVVFIVTNHLSPNIWLTPLMILGAQWYILFNVIAGASTLPKDLLQVVDNLGVMGWLRWSRLLLPGIFPYYITGAITAAGGCWNASIVAEVASWGKETLVATGLGAYITQYTNEGSFSRIALGIGIMCCLVLIFNRLVWRPLYAYAVNRFLLSSLAMSDPIIEIINAQKSFKTGDRQELLALNDINLRMYEGEIIAILGKSGSGKSTLLRIIAGLMPPSRGTVYYRGNAVAAPVRGISMVFQTFALLPWLTVMQNVELGLEALGVERSERRERSLKAIDMIGLDGFETALPKELSGGMRQRVGFARALVVNPDILLMDEPFSALDVLTADNLKSDLIDLWQSKKTGLNGILFVTHSIEEAITIADRIIVFNSNPGSIRSDLKITLPFPRSDLDPRFRNQVDRVYTLMTTQMQEEVTQEGENKPMAIDIGYRLPDATVAEVTGLLEILNSPELPGKMDLPVVADTLMLNIDDLFPLTELLEILRFAKVSKGDIAITDEGKAFVEADILERKKIFAVLLKKYVPLARYIYDQLNRHPRHRALEENYLSLLEDYLSEAEAERVLRTVIEWGRYAELFAYDYNSGVLSLENPH